MAVPSTTAEAVLKPSTRSFCTNKPKVRGYTFKDPKTQQLELNYDQLLASFETTGIQAKELATAFSIADEMLAIRRQPYQEDASIEDEFIRPKTGCTIFVSFNSDTMYCGLRDCISYLVKHRLVDCLVTTLDAVELDLKLEAKHYTDFFKTCDNIISPSKLTHWLGSQSNDENSICYWACKNKIPVFCPATSSVIFKQALESRAQEGIVMDKISDIRRINTFAHNTEKAKTGVIILGGGVPKHHTMNANLMRNGADYSIYLNTEAEFDASDSGAEPDEAVSWGKMRANAKAVKVNCDPAITLPLLVARSFSVDKEEEEDPNRYKNLYLISNNKHKIEDSKLVAAFGLLGNMLSARKKTGCTIFLTYTSNMISSGVREHIKFLVEHKLVDCLVTTAGGIEEDLIKCLGSSKQDRADTYVGSFRLSGSTLREHGINRIGNLLVPNDNYCLFEDWLIPILDKMLQEKEVWPTSRLIERLGLEINDTDSVCYWAAKNNIPIFCPAITDGSLGDMLHFHSFRSPGLKNDEIADFHRFETIYKVNEKTGAIILGGGEAKRFAECGREFSHKIVIDSVGTRETIGPATADATTVPQSSKTNALQSHHQTVKITSDVSIIFPIMIAKIFFNEARRQVST